jgi:hypothetical protein
MVQEVRNPALNVLVLDQVVVVKGQRNVSIEVGQIADQRRQKILERRWSGRGVVQT